MSGVLASEVLQETWAQIYNLWPPDKEHAGLPFADKTMYNAILKHVRELHLDGSPYFHEAADQFLKWLTRFPCKDNVRTVRMQLDRVLKETAVLSTYSPEFKMLRACISILPIRELILCGRDAQRALALAINEGLPLSNVECLKVLVFSDSDLKDYRFSEDDSTDEYATYTESYPMGLHSFASLRTLELHGADLFYMINEKTINGFDALPLVSLKLHHDGSDVTDVFPFPLFGHWTLDECRSFFPTTLEMLHLESTDESFAFGDELFEATRVLPRLASLSLFEVTLFLADDVGIAEPCFPALRHAELGLGDEDVHESVPSCRRLFERMPELRTLELYDWYRVRTLSPIVMQRLERLRLVGKPMTTRDFMELLVPLITNEILVEIEICVSTDTEDIHKELEKLKTQAVAKNPSIDPAKLQLTILRNDYLEHEADLANPFD